MGKNKRAANVPTEEKEMPTFLSYNALDFEGHLFFAHSGLNRFIGIAAKLLATRIRTAAIHSLDGPYFSKR